MMLVPSSAVASTSATAATPASASMTTSAASAGTSAPATAVAASIWASIWASISATVRGPNRIAVEVRFWLVREVAATFDGERRRTNFTLGFAATFCSTLGSSAVAAAHLGALLLKDCFARKTDTVALDRQHLHQHLVAFFQFVTDVFNAMLRDFADVQQAVGAGDDFDECAEIGQYLLSRMSTPAAIASIPITMAGIGRLIICIMPDTISQMASRSIPRFFVIFI